MGGMRSYCPYTKSTPKKYMKYTVYITPCRNKKFDTQSAGIKSLQRKTQRGIASSPPELPPNPQRSPPPPPLLDRPLQRTRFPNGDPLSRHHHQHSSPRLAKRVRPPRVQPSTYTYPSSSFPPADDTRYAHSRPQSQIIPRHRHSRACIIRVRVRVRRQIHEPPLDVLVRVLLRAAPSASMS